MKGKLFLAACICAVAASLLTLGSSAEAETRGNSRDIPQTEQTQRAGVKSDFPPVKPKPPKAIIQL